MLSCSADWSLFSPQFGLLLKYRNCLYVSVFGFVCIGVNQFEPARDSFSIVVYFVVSHKFSSLFADVVEVAVGLLCKDSSRYEAEAGNDQCKYR